METKLYPKISTLWKFDQGSKRFVELLYKDPSVEVLKDNLWMFTQKIDGMNFRIIWDGYKLCYGGRTDRAEFSKAQVAFILEHLLNDAKEILFEQRFGDKAVVVFGELFGKGIETIKGNGALYVENTPYDYGFRVFDVSINDNFVRMADVQDIADALGYVTVPMLFYGTLKEAIYYVKNTDSTTHFLKAPLEGVVGRPFGEFRDCYGHRILVKIKKEEMGKWV